MSNFNDVLEFHQRMGLPVGDFKKPSLLPHALMQQRIDFMMEELMELAGAANIAQLIPDDGNPQNDELRLAAMAEIFDGLLDLVYVACGTGVMMGVPWEQGYALVQEANMAKQRVEGKDGEHHRGIIKPEGWKSPDIAGLLKEVGA